MHTPDDMAIELRCHIKRRYIDLIDGLVLARRLGGRGDILEEILEAWANQLVHESTIVLRMSRGNPSDAET